MTDTTTVSLKETTKSDLDDLKRVDGESYDSVVRMLIASYSDDSDESITDHNSGQELDADDVVRACRKAIREELPVGEMGQ